MARVLFHIDLNAFFASAEELRHPEYKDKPLAVGSLSARGVLATANYAARELGIHSAMPTMQAKAMVPDLVIIEGDHDYYRKLSSKFFAYLKQYSGMLEPLSIDECFLDVTNIISKYPRPLDLAVQIQQGILDEIGLKCSIGVGPNRFLAKMASDMKKPMGITVLRKSEIPSKLWPLPVEKMIGVGKKTLPKLLEAGIETIGDLANPDNENTVLEVCKASGMNLIRHARGQGSDKLIFSSTQKSISMSRTYPQDIYTLLEAENRVRELCQALSGKMRRDNQKGMMVSLILRDGSFHNEMHSRNLQSYTCQFEPIFEAASGLLADYFEPVGYRHIGISIGSLKDADKILIQPTIFEPAISTSQDVIARLNKQMDSKVFMKASDLLKKDRDGGKNG